MTPRARRIRVGMAGILLAGLSPAVAAAQTEAPLSPEAWIATDSIRFLSYLGVGRSGGRTVERSVTPRVVAVAALILTMGFASEASGQTAGREPARAQAELPTFSEVVNGRTELVTYRGVRAVKLVPAPETAGKDEDVLALLDGADFKDGTIQLDVAGAPRPGMPADSRGFIGVSCRTGAHGAWSEVFYLRPTNGRADDQLRRNHAVQYASDPEFPWYRLRKESPGVYESYADMEAGAWTTMKIEVAGTKARLYVNGASQPCLVINDLKHGDRAGRIALWAHVETDAYFGPIRITAR